MNWEHSKKAKHLSARQIVIKAAGILTDSKSNRSKIIDGVFKIHDSGSSIVNTVYNLPKTVSLFSISLFKNFPLISISFQVDFNVQLSFGGLKAALSCRHGFLEKKKPAKRPAFLFPFFAAA
ncbi:hypothetical protein IM774_03775 [Erysipelotrichaceae bacterium RD49]|nr:hypothetical protein [Erysipelotrichaceae bacterium RD49]